MTRDLTPKPCAAIPRKAYEAFAASGYRLPLPNKCGKPGFRAISWYPHPDWRCRGCFYREYLRSSAWERLRDRKIRAAHRRCERCGQHAGRGKNGDATGLNVHHLTYDRLGEESDDDLIVLCRSCHEAVHQGESLTFDAATSQGVGW